MIDFRDVSVTAYAGETIRTILHPFSLTLGERRISIIGSNGSGKSTFARLINGLVLPSSGQVFISAEDAPNNTQAPAHGATDVAASERRARLDTAKQGAKVRRAVGFLFTNPVAQLIMPTVLEDVSLSLRRVHRDTADRNVAAMQVLSRFGLEGLALQSVHTLSGGQQQLVALASVLACEPHIIVADEPTTLLDLRNSRMIAEHLARLSQQVITVTHDLELALQADRTLVVDDGHIVFDGLPAEAVGFYRDLVKPS